MKKLPILTGSWAIRYLRENKVRPNIQNNMHLYYTTVRYNNIRAMKWHTYFVHY